VGGEWLGFVRLNEARGFVGDAVGGVRVSFRTWRRQVGGRIEELSVADQSRSKALCVGRIGARSKMPFAGEEIRISRLAHCLRQSDFLERKLMLVWRRPQFARATAAEKIRDARARRKFPREYARARRRTDRACRISLRKAHAFGGEAVEVRRVIKRA